MQQGSRVEDIAVNTFLEIFVELLHYKQAYIDIQMKSSWLSKYWEYVENNVKVKRCFLGLYSSDIARCFR